MGRRKKVYPAPAVDAEALALSIARNVLVFGVYDQNRPEGPEFDEICKMFKPYLDRLVSGGLDRDTIRRTLWTACISYRDDGSGSSLMSEFEYVLRTGCDGYTEAARQGLYRQNVYARSYNSTGFTAWEDRNWTSQPEELGIVLADADRKRRAGQGTESPS